MTFVSHAQNFEDVMLWRCFRQLETGFYIDIGAGDPVIDSVTKSFYENGWSGINIEPTMSAFAKLEFDRPRDINLEVAVAEQEGDIEFWSVPSTGLSTAVKKFADQHESAGFDVKQVLVKTRTLKNICTELVRGPINFLKIDVEGFEKQVLSGADFEKFRPMVIIVESTEPNSQVENHLEWEYLLTKSNYYFCYGDGLNRYYLAKESENLEKHFKYPPNVFDQFVISRSSPFFDSNLFLGFEDSLKLSLEERNRVLEESIKDLEYSKKELTQQRDELTQQRDELTNSTIWKLTKPLRDLINFIK